MNTERTKLKVILPKAASAFLVFWLSSVLVLVCCAVMPVEVSAAAEVPECHKKQDSKDVSNKISESEKETADCCVFKPNKTLSGDLKNQQNIKQSQTVTLKQELPKPVYFIKNSYKPSKIYHSSIRNRGSTYIQNCVFRI